jgi:hypothetical protein
MKQNVSKKGKMARLLAAGVLAMVTRRMKLPLWAQIAVAAVGVEGFLSGVTGYCPVNHALGIQEA